MSKQFNWIYSLNGCLIYDYLFDVIIGVMFKQPKFSHMLLRYLPTRAHIYPHEHIFTHTSTYLPTRAHIYPHEHIFTHTSTYLPTRAHIYPHEHIFTHTSTYLPTRAHIYPHEHIFTHIYLQNIL